MKNHLFLAAALMLAACGGKPAPGTAAAPEAKPVAYKIALTFTPRTIERLKELGEKAIVSSLYYGRAKPEAKAQADPSGQRPLDENRMEVDPVNQIVKIAAAPFSPADTKDIDGEPMLLVNVFTARKTGPDNLISCGIFDGSLAKAAEEPIAIECDLIEPESAIPHGEIVATPHDN